MGDEILAIKSINAFLNYMQKEKNSTKNTLESYNRDLTAFAEYLKSNGISNLASATKNNIQQYIAYLKDSGKSASTIHRSLSGIRSYYQFLLINNLIFENPAKNIKYEAIERKMPDILTADEVDKLLSQPKLNSPKGFRDKAMLELLYASGIKVSELISLKINDIILPLHVVMCKTSKGERTIPIYPEAIASITEYITRIRPLMIEDDTDALFVNLNGTPLTRQGFWKILKEYAKSANIEKDITPQAIRHSFAAHLLQNGADLKSIQAMLGHSDISSTSYYTKVVANKYKDVYKKYHPKA